MNIKLKCENCGIEFERKIGEYHRNLKKNRRIFCSRKCCGHGVTNNLPKEKNTIGLNSSNRKDDFSPFRWHFRNIKRRESKICAITLKDLKNQWEMQKGICPYTGWKLKNMETTNYLDQLPKTPDRASLDRIDSTKGYILGNIQFISLMAQYAKAHWKEENLFKFCEAVSEKQKIFI